MYAWVAARSTVYTRAGKSSATSSSRPRAATSPGRACCSCSVCWAAGVPHPMTGLRRASLPDRRLYEGSPPWSGSCSVARGPRSRGQRTSSRCCRAPWTAKGRRGAGGVPIAWSCRSRRGSKPGGKSRWLWRRSSTWHRLANRGGCRPERCSTSGASPSSGKNGRWRSRARALGGRHATRGAVAVDRRRGRLDGLGRVACAARPRRGRPRPARRGGAASTGEGPLPGATTLADGAHPRRDGGGARVVERGAHSLSPAASAGEARARRGLRVALRIG